MGGSQSRRDKSFRANQWEQAHDIQIPPQSQGQYTVVRNRVTGQLLDKYSLQFPNENQYNKYLQSINHRRNQSNIVRVIHYEPAVVKQFCGSSFLLNVYLEHCKSRLSQYQDIPFPDYLYCAMALLEGYKKLYNKVGRFYVSERQAMIDNDGQIRVWLNQDFSENQAQDLRIDHYSSHNPSQQQYAMVQDIMRIIFENSDLSQGPGIKLVDFYQRQKNNLSHRVGFEEAKSIIHEYSRINQIQIPDIFKSVYQIYQAQADERQYQDTLSFKNQLFNQDQQEYHNLNKAGHSYQPVQSIVNTAVPVSTNFINRASPVYHSQISPNNLSPRITTNIISNQSTSNRQVQISTPNYGFSSQPSFAPHVLPSVNPISLPVYPHMQRPPIQQQIPVRPTQQGFPITIRPPQLPFMNNIPLNHNPVPYPNQHFQNFPIPRQNKPMQPIININRPSAVLQPVNNQPIQQIKPLFQQFANNSPKANFEAPNQIENTINTKFVNQQDEHQIQKKILKQNTIFHQDVNEANIIRDLNQLHKIEQQEKSRRSINQDTSRNLVSNTSGFDRDRQHYNLAENDDHHGIDSSRKYQTRNQYSEENRHQNHQERQSQGNFNFEAGYVTESIGDYGTTQYTTGYQNQENKQINNEYYHQYKSPRQQISQAQTYSGFNPHSNNQALNFNGTLINKNNQRQFNQYNASNQVNQISINQGFTSQDLNSKQIFKSMGHTKKQSYYTLSSEVQLDPQIAADLASYIQS